MNTTYEFSFMGGPRPESFQNKYSPSRFEDFVLPRDHSLAQAKVFLFRPRPSVWLLHGKIGLGKSTMATLMASAAAGDPSCVQTFVGSALTPDTVRELIDSTWRPPLMGRLHAIVVDEADLIPPGSKKIITETLTKPKYAAWFFTTNKKPKDFDAKFVSRTKRLYFSAHGMAIPAAKWLAGIAAKEGLSLLEGQAEKLVRDRQNDLRQALSDLENMCDNAAFAQLADHPRELERQAA
jgi:DNA polymerase III delta prime subunit